jgi:hypothetical protein
LEDYGMEDMETKMKLFFDPVGNTLTVWFGDPDQEHLCEETGNDVILMKDQEGRVIGFEKLNFTPVENEMPLVSFGTMAAAGIQADIKAMSANGVFAMSVITAITAQNTEEVTDVFELPASIIEAQIDSVFDDLEQRSERSECHRCECVAEKPIHG